jgi:hypothetical protein
LVAFAGFDISEYPGDDMMAWLKANTNLSFCGFYLAPAACHRDASWMDKRSTLAAQGWGFAAVYLGQQEPGHNCSANELTPVKAQEDGQNAADLMQQAGFPTGSVVYLDIETGGPPSAATAAYFQAWVDAVTNDGTYRPGVYCSHSTAAYLLATRAVPVWTWNIAKPAPPADYATPYWINDPARSGVGTASIWQYAQNVPVSFDGAPTKDLVADFDYGASADPSAPPTLGDAVVA